MAGHTKGTWIVDGFEIYADEDCATHPVADCTPNSSCRLEDEAIANARLISSAPDLLEALIEAAEALERCRYSEQAMAKKCRGVIAKATQP